MTLPGFPNQSQISEMFGYVTAEDKSRWNSQKEASDRALDNSRSGLTAKGLASQAAAPAIGMAEKSINAQMHAEQMSERERQRRSGEEEVEVTETRKRRSYIPRDEPKQSTGDREMGF